MKTEARLERRVAVLIIAVTLFGAFVAFLQTQAGNREASADRRAQAASIDAMSAVVDSYRRFGRQDFVFDSSNDQDLFRQAYSRERGPAASYARALAAVYRDGSPALRSYMVKLFGSEYRLPDNQFDVFSFYEDELKGGYWNGELQKAHARERDDWGSKGKRYVTVITILALALFLLGLTLTVPGNPARAFFWAGTVVAAGAAVWTGVIWVERVERPSQDAIAAFVDGQARFDVTEIFVRDQPTRAQQLELIAGHFGRAIEERSTYEEAYLGRGTAAFFRDLERVEGPRGSEPARADFVRATRLNRDNFIAWGNLGAAQFWLNDYEAALESTAEALRLQPDDVIFNLNRALFLIVSGRTDAYRDQMGRVREVFAAAPNWLQKVAMLRYDEVVAQGLKFRPRIAQSIQILRADLREMYASMRTNGDPSPRRIDAELGTAKFVLTTPGAERSSGGSGVRLGLRLGTTGVSGPTFRPRSSEQLARAGRVSRARLLRASFAFDDVEPSDRWLFDTYVDGVRIAELSHGPERWRFKVPDGRFVLELPGAGNLYRPGVEARTEIFVEGNLVGVAEYTFAS